MITVSEYIENVQNACIEISKCTNDSGDTNYPYAFGYFISQLQWTLNDLDLTKKQLKVLETRLNRLNRV